MAASEEHIRSFSERAADEEPPEKATTRFLMELEFVQCLANPKYLHCMWWLHVKTTVQTSSIMKNTEAHCVYLLCVLSGQIWRYKGILRTKRSSTMWSI